MAGAGPITLRLELENRKTPDDYHALAATRGFEWLGPWTGSVIRKTRWRCLEGHEWEARFNGLQQGSGCPTCADARRSDSRRFGPAAYETCARERGFEWLGPFPGTTAAKTRWRCREGHEWDSPFGNISRGSGCPHCSGKARKLPDDYHALACERDYEWLGPYSGSSRRKTRWRCPEGHEWEASYSLIRSGHGCWPCAIVRVADSRRFGVAEYRHLASSRGLEWLGPLPNNTGENSPWRCTDGHEWSASYDNIRAGKGCPACAGLVPKSAADYVALADELGISWLGPAVPNTATKTAWKCGEGHEWWSPFRDIQAGYGCNACANVRRAEAQRLPESDYEQLAASRDFAWIGPYPGSVDRKTTWRGSCGHEWEATYSHIGAGRGCPLCIDMVNGARVSKTQRALCTVLSGELNALAGRYRIDIAIERDGVPIAIEYDSWYWHGEHDEQDASRDRYLQRNGWRVLHVRSNEMLPAEEQLADAVARLLAGEKWIEIVLEDWGVGPTRAEST